MGISAEDVRTILDLLRQPGGGGGGGGQPVVFPKVQTVEHISDQYDFALEIDLSTARTLPEAQDLASMGIEFDAFIIERVYAAFDFRFNNTGGVMHYAYQGFAVSGFKFTEIYIKNSAAAADSKGIIGLFGRKKVITQDDVLGEP